MWFKLEGFDVKPCFSIFAVAVGFVALGQNAHDL